MFDVHVKDCVAVVVDPRDPRFGQTAEITAHDWQEYGKVFVRFPDDNSAELDDGLMSNDAILPQVLIFRRSEAEKVLGLQREFAGIRIKLQETQVVAQNSNLPLNVRLAAKKEFRKLCLQPVTA